MAMPSKDDRIRMQHLRLENEKKYQRQAKMFESDLDGRFSDLTRKEIMIRKQQERLENEKQYNKSHSHLTKDRKLSLHGKESSGSPLPSLQDVKSKLFDYEKSSPRSRRQLRESGSATPNASSPRPSGETNKVSNTDVTSQLGVNVDENKIMTSRTASPSPLRHGHTELEQQASKRSQLHPDLKVKFSEELPNPGMNRQKSFDRLAPSSPNRSPRRHSIAVPSIKIMDAKKDDHDEEEDRVKLQALYNKAIETVKQADESLLGESHSKSRAHKDRPGLDRKSKSGFDINALKELETILNDARTYSSRKSSKEDHSRLDLGSNRAQKKRIEHLEQVLKQLNPKKDEMKNEMDPFQVLQCSYLRLSKSNVETLESMIRQDGKDPGIHIHSDVTDYDIWQGIHEERKDQQDTKAKDVDTPRKTATTNKKSTKIV